MWLCSCSHKWMSSRPNFCVLTNWNILKNTLYHNAKLCHETTAFKANFSRSKMYIYTVHVATHLFYSQMDKLQTFYDIHIIDWIMDKYLDNFRHSSTLKLWTWQPFFFFKLFQCYQISSHVFLSVTPFLTHLNLYTCLFSYQLPTKNLKVTTTSTDNIKMHI